jgi:hypothetical protein
MQHLNETPSNIIRAKLKEAGIRGPVEELTKRGISILLV